MSCGVGCRCGSDLVLLWLWHRPAATALIGPLAWEPPYAMDVALKRQKTKKQNKQKNTQKSSSVISGLKLMSKRNNLPKRLKVKKNQILELEKSVNKSKNSLESIGH